MTTHKNTKFAVFCLLGIVGMYAISLIFMFYISVLVGELQNIKASVLWGGLTLWCAYHLAKNSNRARKWSIFLFGLHSVIALFYIIFPLDVGTFHTAFMFGALAFFIAGTLGLYFAVKAKAELAN